MSPCGGGGACAGSIMCHTAEAAPSGLAGAEGAWGGERVPLEGSHPDWVEGRGSRCVRRADIDDASRRVYAQFYAYEGTIPAMDRFHRDVTRYGIPLAVYADKHTTYPSPAPPTVDEPLARVTPLSQFGWASWGSS